MAKFTVCFQRNVNQTCLKFLIFKNADISDPYFPLIVLYVNVTFVDGADDSSATATSSVIEASADGEYENNDILLLS